MAKPSSHYFLNDETLEDDIKEFSFSFRGAVYKFTSNSGVFSPGHVDDASALLMREMPEINSGKFLDLGCGYGAIGISLAGAAARNAGVENDTRVTNLFELTMADVNERALDLAKLNAAKNGIEAEFILSDCFDNIDGSFDAISLNPPIHAGKEVIFKMYEQSFEHLNEGGALYIVIQEKHGAPSTIKKLKEVFGNCTTLYKKKGYYVLESKR